MNYVVAIGALALTATSLCAQVGPARAQNLDNSKIEITYEVPKQAEHQPIYERLQKREVLEQLKQFLAPLRLPKKLPIKTTECGVVNAFYLKGSGLSLCYEYLHYLEDRVAKAEMPSGYLRSDALVGGFLSVTFHELGHAVFDILNVPVFGREEDAADQMAGFVLQQFGPKIARRMITGAAYMWLGKQDWPRTTFSDEHGSDLQRHYNFLCLGYGGNPAAFQDFVDQGALPKERAAHCAREYQQVRNAFAKTVLPFVDQGQMKKVEATEWLRQDDFQ